MGKSGFRNRRRELVWNQTLARQTMNLQIPGLQYIWPAYSLQQHATTQHWWHLQWGWPMIMGSHLLLLSFSQMDSSLRSAPMLRIRNKWHESWGFSSSPEKANKYATRSCILKLTPWLSSPAETRERQILLLWYQQELSWGKMHAQSKYEHIQLRCMSASGWKGSFWDLYDECNSIGWSARCSRLKVLANELSSD